jgi:hypothetical protein
MSPLLAAPSITLKPTHAPVRAYYLALAQLANVGAAHIHVAEDSPAEKV